MFDNMEPDLVVYAIVGGILGGIVLSLSRKHMTGRATFLFSMLYWLLFTGLVNTERFFFNPETFSSHFYSGMTRALIFATAAGLTVWAARRKGRKRFLDFMGRMEEDI